MRRVKTIAAAEDEFFDKIWYSRHMYLKQRIESGEKTCDPEVWKRALKAEKRIREKYGGEENILPKNDFEWGMLNGKLSALRWVLGDEWDFLDT